MRALTLTLLLVAACSNSNNSNHPDLATAENPDLAPACSNDPMTHLELLNACSNADSVDKMPFYPTLAENGQLPPLP